MITKEEYEQALVRLEELLPKVNSSKDADFAELKEVSDKIITYEKVNYPVNSEFSFFTFYPVDSILSYGYIKLKVELNKIGCIDCIFNRSGICGSVLCCPSERKDNTNVVFKDITNG